MPTRTVLPTISITWTTTSSPTMIFSPARRVMSSMVPPWISCGKGREGFLRGGGDGREQRGADGGVLGLVDHLVAAAVGDDDRRAEVRVEVGELGAGTDRDPHVDVSGVARADVARGLVGQLDRVVGEEVPGVGDRQGQRRIVDGVQPREGAVVAGGHERVARAAEPDQAGGELDDLVDGDLEGPEARGVDGDSGHWEEGLLEEGGNGVTCLIGSAEEIH